MTDKQHEIEEFRKLINLYHSDIAVFAKQVFNSDLTPKQQEFCEAFRTSKRITFKGGVGFGKSFSLALLVWWSLICHDHVKVSIFGVSEGQLRQNIWNEVKLFHDRMHPLFKDAFAVQETTIRRLVNHASCFAELRLADKSNTIRAKGIHAKHNFVICDEAAGMDDEVFTEALNGIFSDGEDAKLCLVSNPDRASGFFWRTWNDPDMSSDWTKVHGTYFDSPKYDPEKQESFEAFARSYGGPTSKGYRINILGEFPLSDVDGLIPRDFIDAAVRNEECVPADNVPVVWGLDPAGAGRDSSVLCIRHDNKLIGFHEWQGLEPTQLAYKVKELFEKQPKPLKPAVIAVDATGLGNGVYSILKDWSLPVYASIFAGTPTRNPDRYSRVRDQLWWEMREWLATENVSIPNHQKLIEELATPTYDDSSGKVKLEDKKAIKKRLGGRSPDYADALALTMAVSPSRFKSKYAWSKPIKYDNLQTFE